VVTKKLFTHNIANAITSLDQSVFVDQERLIAVVFDFTVKELTLTCKSASNGSVRVVVQRAIFQKKTASMTGKSNTIAS
jgi:hypothetical protein